MSPIVLLSTLWDAISMPITSLPSLLLPSPLPCPPIGDFRNRTRRELIHPLARLARAAVGLGCSDAQAARMGGFTRIGERVSLLAAGGAQEAATCGQRERGAVREGRGGDHQAAVAAMSRMERTRAKRGGGNGRGGVVEDRPRVQAMIVL